MTLYKFTEKLGGNGTELYPPRQGPQPHTLKGTDGKMHFGVLQEGPRGMWEHGPSVSRLAAAPFPNKQPL